MDIISNTICSSVKSANDAVQNPGQRKCKAVRVYCNKKAVYYLVTHVTMDISLPTVNLHRNNKFKIQSWETLLVMWTPIDVGSPYQSIKAKVRLN